MKTPEEFTESEEHLPDFLRDFHSQKDIFKTIHWLYSGKDHAKEISWIDGHCYTIDWFLWFMAKHGYTLQKSRKSKVS